MANTIQWLAQIPKSKRTLYWPSKETTIPKAVSWFRKEHGVVPELVVGKSKRWDVIQDVSMWAAKAPTPIHLHLVRTYGKVLGEAKYKEQLNLWMHEKKRKKNRM